MIALLASTVRRRKELDLSGFLTSKAEISAMFQTSAEASRGRPSSQRVFLFMGHCLTPKMLCGRDLALKSIMSSIWITVPIGKNVLKLRLHLLELGIVWCINRRVVNRGFFPPESDKRSQRHQFTLLKLANLIPAFSSKGNTSRCHTFVHMPTATDSP
ncbi:hypothetical protein AVEN_113888-1 [Araneus ventricosus]|uniref:Uncharacterized protein n=1 Tax=Araneus ventricosus TaxID=182803 RepID=A0A4Y2S782_ARAVE|nr:hypothetical protein AVEN_113888-1 [Araneus ventricosus]